MKFDSQILMSEKYAPWVIATLLGLFGLLILINLGYTVYMPVLKEDLTQTAPVHLAKSTESSYQTVIEAALFGAYVPKDLDESEVRQSMLNVELVGILFADKIEESQVIIRSQAGEEKIYMVGDKLPGGAVLKRIMVNGVLVEHNGVLERLTLPKAELTFAPEPEPLNEDFADAEM